MQDRRITQGDAYPKASCGLPTLLAPAPRWALTTRAPRCSISGFEITSRGAGFGCPTDVELEDEKVGVREAAEAMFCSQALFD